MDSLLRSLFWKRGTTGSTHVWSGVPIIIWWSCGFCADFLHYPVHHVRLWLLIHMIVTTTHWGLGQTLINWLCAMDGHQIIHYIIMHYNFILEFVSIQLNLPYFLNNGRFGWQFQLFVPIFHLLVFKYNYSIYSTICFIYIF